jgi:quercetin dioxygenase-like cupin family protein
MCGITSFDVFDVEPDIREDGLTELRKVQVSDGIDVVRVTWKPGHRSSPQAHDDQHELLIIQSGTLLLYADNADEPQAAEAGAIIDIPPGVVHRHAVPEDATEAVVVWAIFVPAVSV